MRATIQATRRGYVEDERYRVHLQSEGVTKEKKDWDRLASGPKRAHVPTEAKSEHWKSKLYLKETTAGADTVPTTKHPDLPTAHSRRLPAASGKIGLIEARHQKDGKGRKVFSKSSDRKIRTLTLTFLKQRRSFGRPRPLF